MAKNNVDGIYDDDPQSNPNAKKLKRVTYLEAIEKRLGIMDSTALTMCMENDVKIVVFDLFESGNLLRAVNGEDLGSVVSHAAND
jgi:uridylate kinase